MNESGTRAERTDQARVSLNSALEAKQRAFLEFVLSHCLHVGVQELDQEKLTPLLRLEHGTIQGAVADLGQAEQIGSALAGFQSYLYAKTAA